MADASVHSADLWQITLPKGQEVFGSATPLSLLYDTCSATLSPDGSPKKEDSVTTNGVTRGDHEMVSLSVIIVNYNSRDYLRSCLESIFSDESFPLEQVVVVDNASSDGSVAMVERDFPAVILVKNNENVGFSKANNQGLSVVSSTHVLLLNPDTYLSIGFFSELMSQATSHNKMGALGCRIANSDGSLQFSFGNFPTLVRIILDRLPFFRQCFGILCRDTNRYNVAQRVGWVLGACLLLNRAAVSEIGGFDEDYFLYVEEVDLCYRLSSAGFENYYIPSPTLIHHNEGCSSSRFTTKSDWNRRGLVLFLAKHRSRWESQCLNFLNKWWGYVKKCM